MSDKEKQSKFKLADAKNYSKIFSQPSKMVSIDIPDSENDLKKKLKVDPDENEGYIGIYSPSEGKNIPIKIYNGKLITYDKYINDARTFIKNELKDDIQDSDTKPEKEVKDENQDGDIDLDDVLGKDDTEDYIKKEKSSIPNKDDDVDNEESQPKDPSDNEQPSKDDEDDENQKTQSSKDDDEKDEEDEKPSKNDDEEDEKPSKNDDENGTSPEEKLGNGEINNKIIINPSLEELSEENKTTKYIHIDLNKQTINNILQYCIDNNINIYYDHNQNKLDKPNNDFHLTIFYSDNFVDIPNKIYDLENINLIPDGFEMFGEFKHILALKIKKTPEIVTLREKFEELGLKDKWPEWNPHITFSYKHLSQKLPTQPINFKIQGINLVVEDTQGYTEEKEDA